MSTAEDGMIAVICVSSASHTVDAELTNLQIHILVDATAVHITQDSVSACTKPMSLHTSEWSHQLKLYVGNADTDIRPITNRQSTNGPVMIQHLSSYAVAL